VSEPEFWNAVLFHLEGIKFCAHVTAFASCWIAGQQGWRIFTYGKNNREIW
jgi:hypothetical protein